MDKPWDIIEFEWDESNINKSWQKHGISSKETEEVFLDPKLTIFPDVKHSKIEKRFFAVGKNLTDDHFFVVFTMRGNKLRVVSVRRMHREEVEKYEKIKENS